MLIPVIFKADGGDSSRKGKIRAEDLSVLSAFSLNQKTGILQVLSQCNAYGISTIPGRAYFYLNSGYVSICGRLIYIEEATQVEVDLPASGTVTGSFGIRVDLTAMGSSECEFFSKTGTLTKIDLNENPTTGIYELELYSYRATNNTFEIIGKTAPIIEAGGKPYANGAMFTTSRTGEIDETETIQEKIENINYRLATLGFDSATYDLTVDGVSSTVSRVTVWKQGKYIMCNTHFNMPTLPSKIWDAFPTNKVLFTLPVEWRPRTDQAIAISIFASGSGASSGVKLCAISAANGECKVINRGGAVSGSTFEFFMAFAYEIA